MLCCCYVRYCTYFMAAMEVMAGMIITTVAEKS
jgi:hypothetical protein